ncbi:hypothetical protein K438DRAFT_309963 [Mycena galopus ATCC 62051]|nr:hypothetical protein K438DRAFT_309963 [Mycena galopus ATCC 62051]
MWSTGRPTRTHLSLCILAALVDAASVSGSGLSCASFDNGGGRLDNSFTDSSINGVHFDLLCTSMERLAPTLATVVSTQSSPQIRIMSAPEARRRTPQVQRIPVLLQNRPRRVLLPPVLAKEPALRRHLR